MLSIPVRSARFGSAPMTWKSKRHLTPGNSMSNITQRLLVLAGMTSDRNTVLKFCEPKGTSRDTLFNRLLNGTYRKPFLIEDLEHRAMCFALDGCTQTEM